MDRNGSNRPFLNFLIPQPQPNPQPHMRKIRGITRQDRFLKKMKEKNAGNVRYKLT